MYGKVKRLRESGKRMSDRVIGTAPYVEGEVRVYMLGSSVMASVSDPHSQVSGPLIPDLYDARVTSMHGQRMLFKGEERPQGDQGPAFVQEWSVQFGD